MKIVHALGWYFPDSVGGTEVYVEGLCRRLRDAGHDVFVAAPDSHRPAERRYLHDGVAVFRYSIPAQPTREEGRQRVVTRGAERFHAWLASTRPDWLHVHTLTTGLGLAELREARRLGIRIVLTCHLPSLGYMCRAGELMQWGSRPCDGIVVPGKCAACSLTGLGLPRWTAKTVAAVPAPLSAVLSSLPGKVGPALGMCASIVEHQTMQRELFDLAEHVVVLNETARRMLVANGSPAAKLTVNRLGLSHAAIVRKPGPVERPTVPPVRFGYLGRLHPTKGLVELARAVRSLPSELRFELEIRGPALDAGSRSFVATLQQMIGRDPRVRFEPAVPSNQVLGILTSLDALLCPSMWFENGPTVAIESIAVGTPVIASSVGNLVELIDDGVNGRLVEAGNVDALAQAIAEAATNPSGTIDRWRRSLPTARTMDDIARDYLALYAGLPAGDRQGVRVD